MSDITKRVDRNVPSTQRIQKFTQADAAQGDILLVEASLGHPARYLLVEATTSMTFRLNVYHTVFPDRDDPGIPYNTVNISVGQQYKDSTSALISLGANEKFESSDFGVSDLEIVTVSGNFSVTVA